MKHFTLLLVVLAAMCTQSMAQNRVKNIYADANSLKVELLQNTEQTVQLNRYLYAGYNTICVPMSMNAEQLAAAANDVRVERFAGIGQEGTTLCLYFVDCTNEGIEAGYPYLIYSPKSQYFRAKNTEALEINTQLRNLTMTDNAGNQVTFGSSWQSMLKDGRYGIPAQQNVTPLESVLVRTEADKTFLPTRCGFTWDKQVNATDLQIKHVSSMAEVTSIRTLGKKANNVTNVYDLKGNLVKKQVKKGDALNSLPTGIYVIDGEKVTVK
jgi:hypothetical protein